MGHRDPKTCRFPGVELGPNATSPGSVQGPLPFPHPRLTRLLPLS